MKAFLTRGILLRSRREFSLGWAPMNMREDRTSGFEPTHAAHAIEQNLLAMVRRSAPVAEVVAGSTPVIAFGDPFRATVATLGINPSRREFLNTNGELLSGPARRLATLASLQAEDPAGLNSEQAAALMADCVGYFRRNPYRSWFDPLNEVVRAATKASYYDNSACHLDLVQWATDPTWGSLPEWARRLLLSEGLPHFLYLLRQSCIRIVLLNGIKVVEQVRSSGLVRLERCGRMPVSATVPCSLYCGELGMVRFVGWSTNLQSSWGVPGDFRSRLSNWLSRKLNSDGSGTVPTAPSEVRFDPHGYIPQGSAVEGKAALYTLLKQWLERTDAPTIGPIGNYGGRAWITITLDRAQVAVLNADTKRAAVQAYVNDAETRRPEVPWRILPSRGSQRWNKLVFHPDGRQTPGWYCYLRPDADGPGQV
jgi:hypothetical protein